MRFLFASFLEASASDSRNRSAPSRKNQTVKAQEKGQALVEFVLIMPLLVLILVGGATFSIGIFQGHMASDAIQFPSMSKLEFSSKETTIDSGTLQAKMNNSGLQGNIQLGSLIDSVSVVDLNGPTSYTSLMVGAKSFNSTVNFVPGFTITVGQAINRSLLLPATSGGATGQDSSNPWVPGGTPNPPPWE